MGGGAVSDGRGLRGLGSVRGGRGRRAARTRGDADGGQRAERDQPAPPPAGRVPRPGRVPAGARARRRLVLVVGAGAAGPAGAPTTERLVEALTAAIPERCSTTITSCTTKCGPIPPKRAITRPGLWSLVCANRIGILWVPRPGKEAAWQR